MTTLEFMKNVTYIVLQSFTDFDGERIEQGRKLTFVSRGYFVYDGGVTLNFLEGSIRLREGDQDEILDHLQDYFAVKANDTWSMR